MFFQQMDNHPQSNQYGLEGLNQSERFVFTMLEDHSRLLTHDMKLFVVTPTERKEKPCAAPNSSK